MQPHMDPYALRPLLVGCILMLSLAGGPVARAAQDEKTANDAIQALLKERLAIVTTIYEQRLETHKAGETSLAQVVEARADLLSAKLDLCETKEERLKLHEEMVKLAGESASALEGLSKAGVIPQVELLKAKLQLVKARLALERAKAAK